MNKRMGTTAAALRGNRRRKIVVTADHGHLDVATDQLIKLYLGDPAHSEAGAVGSAGLCGTGAFTGSSRPAGHIWANVFSLVRRSSQSSCVLSNWDTPKASPIALPRGSTVSGLQSAPMRGRLRLWSIVRWRPGTGSRQAAAPVRTRRSRATRMCAHATIPWGKRTERVILVK